MKEVKVATQPWEIKEALEFRYHYMCKWNRYVKDKGSAKESIGDEFDEYTDYVVCKEYGVVKGIVRLIRPNTTGFFMQRFVDPRPFLKGKRYVIELSEYITHPEFRRDTDVLKMLIRKSFEHVKLKNYDAAVSISIRSMHRLVERLGFKNTNIEIDSEWGVRMTLFVLLEPALAYSGIDRYLK